VKVFQPLVEKSQKGLKGQLFEINVKQEVFKNFISFYELLKIRHIQIDELHGDPNQVFY
jgi:hypothetical protein